MDTLQLSRDPLSTAALRCECEHKRELELTPDDAELTGLSPAQQRSVRVSMDRALRGLVAAGKIRRNDDGHWEPMGEWPARKAREEDRTKTAFHEAGHAVIGLATGLQVGAAIIDKDRRGKVTELGDGGGGVVVSAHRAGSIRYFVRGRKLVETDLDAFGRPAPQRPEQPPEEHHAEVIMCIGGGMAQAKLQGDIADWRTLASSTDMSIARRHRTKLGDAAKTWEEYESEAAALVKRFWPMIQAVASALLQKSVLSGDEIDSICGRIRRHELKNKSKRSRATRLKSEAAR